MRNKYSLSEFIKTSYAFALTKAVLKDARLIRRPVYIRGKTSIVGGRGLTTGYSCRFDLKAGEKTLFIGDNCEFGDMTHIVAYQKVVIGNNVLIASKCFISDTNHGTYKGEIQDSPYTAPNSRELVSESVIIGNNVWIGENAVILSGAVIGDGCIIGANSVIKGKIPENCIVAGNGRIIRKYNDKSGKWELQEQTT